MRTPEVAAFDLACANAALETLRHAITTRDREAARNPLRQVAARLGIALDESDPDWQRVAFRGLRVMLDAEMENLRRDHGAFDASSAALRAARQLVDGPDLASPVTIPPVAMPVAPCGAATETPPTGHFATNAAAFTPSSVSAQKEIQPRIVRDTTLKVEPPEQARASTSCPTIEKGSEHYIAARS